MLTKTLAVQCVLFGCLTAGAFAETKTIEPELFDLLGDDLKVKTVTKQETPVDDKTPDIKIVNKQQASSKSASSRPQSSQIILREENSPLTSAESNASPEKQLRKARISTSVQNENNQTKDELALLIEQISSVKLTPQPAKKQSKSIKDAAIESESAEQVPGTDTTESTDEKIEAKSEPGSVSEQTMLMIRKRLAAPDQLKDPLGLGELLYESGCFDDAQACYRLVLDRVSDDKADSLKDKPWVLFQLGNCLQKKDLTAALEYYDLVVLDFPESMWKPAAQAKSEWIRWKLQDKPKTLAGNKAVKTGNQK